MTRLRRQAIVAPFLGHGAGSRSSLSDEADHIIVGYSSGGAVDIIARSSASSWARSASR